MKYKISNNGTPIDYENEINSLTNFAKDRFRFQKPPSFVLQDNPDNANKLLGKTGFYDPNTMEIHIFTTGRHPKDILRSIAHELVHHMQNDKGELNHSGYSGQGYAQKNPHLREMERQAYEMGNLCFRDWEDSLKQEQPTIYNERRNHKMSLKEWKNNELGRNLTERWGFKMDLSKLNESKEITHMCALHVIHESTGREGHPIKHTLNESGDVSHYTVEFSDVIVEDIPVENLKILQQEEHTHKRDDEKSHDKKKKVVSEEELEESEKPDFPDVDGDGDRDEPISKAQKDNKEKGGEEKSEKPKKGKMPPGLAAYHAKKGKE